MWYNKKRIINYMIDDFIGVFDNVISNELCDKLIKVYEDSNPFLYRSCATMFW